MHRKHPTIPVIQHPRQFDVNRYPQNDGLFGGTTVSIDCFSGVSFMASNVAKISGGIRIPCWNFERAPGVMREVLSYTWDVGHCNGSLENVEAQLEMFFFSKKKSVQQGRLGFVEGDFLRIVPMVNHHQITTILGDVFLKTSSKHFLPADPRKLPGWKTSDSVTHIFQAKIWLEVSIRLFFPGYLKKMLLKLSLKQIQDGLVKNPPTVRFLVVRETQNGETRFFF